MEQLFSDTHSYRLVIIRNRQLSSIELINPNYSTSIHRDFPLPQIFDEPSSEEEWDSTPSPTITPASSHSINLKLRIQNPSSSRLRLFLFPYCFLIVIYFTAANILNL